MTLEPTEPIDLFANTHVGLVHETNEDSYALANLPDGGVMLLVCDGMGGMGRGGMGPMMDFSELDADGDGQVTQAEIQELIAVMTEMKGQG